MTHLNDSLESLFTGDTGPVRTVPVRESAVEFKSAEQLFEEKCAKCRGTGRFISWSGRAGGQCFACKGAGKFQFKTSPEARAAKRASTGARKGRSEQESLDAFAAANPEISAWIEAKHLRFNFAADMRAAILRFGSLTEGKLAACQRFMDQDAAKAAASAERIQQAPQIASDGVDRLKAAFDKAKAFAAAKATGLTIRNPKITIGGMSISPAKASSANAGALYVKAGSVYLGKIVGGKFFASRDCQQEDQAKILRFVADPAAAAKVYGQETGVCCVCNATLKSAWRLRGIGPICAEKMGWAGLAEDFGVEV